MDAEEKPDDELVLLTTCSDNLEASSLQSWLEANGVYCFLQGEHHRGLLGPLGPYIELRVLVPSSAASLARSLALARLAPATLPDPDVEEGDDDGDDADEEALVDKPRRGLRVIALLLAGAIGWMLLLAVNPRSRPHQAGRPAAPVNRAP